jgi:hypothetical protein
MTLRELIAHDLAHAQEQPWVVSRGGPIAIARSPGGKPFLAFESPAGEAYTLSVAEERVGFARVRYADDTIDVDGWAPLDGLVSADHVNGPPMRAAALNISTQRHGCFSPSIPLVQAARDTELFVGATAEAAHRIGVLRQHDLAGNLQHVGEWAQVIFRGAFQAPDRESFWVRASDLTPIE